MNSTPPPPTNASEWLPELSPEALVHIDALRPNVELLLFYRQLRDALGLDQEEFAQLFTDNTSIDQSLEASPPDITMAKLLQFLKERDGTMSLTIVVGGAETIIHS